MISVILTLLLGNGEIGQAKPTDQAFKMLQGKVGQEIEKSELRKRLGAPKHVSKQVYRQRSREQWLYEEPSRWLVELDCRLGEIPKLLRVEPIPSLIRP